MLPEITERRRVQRVRPPQPLRATIDGQRALIVDLSLRGMRVLHQEAAGDTSCVVRAEWDGQPMELHCGIVRTLLHRDANYGGRMLYHTGLTIARGSESTMATLRRLIEHHVERALDEQKANARGVPPPLAAQSTPTGTTPSAFVRHEFSLGRWREVMTPSAVQPDNGFTIGAQTAPAEVEMLRHAYERATTAGDVAVIRRLAAMSVSGAEVVQARRYMP